jgi:integrase
LKTLSKQDLVNWEDPALQRWLDTIMKMGTKYNYRTAFRAYTAFTGMTASALVDEALEDAKRDPRERRDIVLKRLIQFYRWLKTEYPRKSRGKGPHEIVGKGISDKAAHMRVAAMRSFYATFGVTVRMKGRHSLPRPRVLNKRMKVSAQQVQVLVDHARTPRDRAIILTLFQGGMDISTLCSLKYGEVSKGLDGNDHPLKLDLYRPKTGVEYYTFLGRDAVKALKAYLSDMRSRGVEFRHNTPLFLKERGKEGGLKTNLAQNMMRTVALNAGFIDNKNNGKAFNPLGPHALRESFGSLMINSGVPDTIVDFWLGHSIGEMSEAYKSVQAESLQKMYLEREHLLNVSANQFDERKLEEKVSEKVDERVQALQRIITNYATENLETKSKMARMELENTDLQSRLKQLEVALLDLKKTVEQLAA